MEPKPENRLLKLPAGAVENIRKLYDLDNPERLDEAIGILEEWIQKQDHFVKKDFSKDYLDITLISCKGSVEKAKKRIDSLCTMKTLIPKFFSKTNVKTELKSVMEIVSVLPLPIVTKDYYRVLIKKLTNENFNSDSFMNYYQYTVNVAEYIKAHDYINGFIIIYDFRQVNLLDLMIKLNTTELQQFITMLVEGYGARLKSIHTITESKTVELLIKTVKQFVSEKIGSRMHVHSTVEHLHSVVPKEILPIDYGGHEKSTDELFEDWMEELSSEKHVEYMKMMSKACTDETKRQAVKFNAEYMGLPGSFRNLIVD